MRAALGAGRGRLIRQFIAESLVLSLVGAAAESRWRESGSRRFVAAGSRSIPRAAAVGIDGRVLAFTLVVAVGTGVMFGLAPLLHLSVEQPRPRAARSGEPHDDRRRAQPHAPRARGRRDGARGDARDRRRVC